MPTILAIAVRNVLRHPRRTVITAATVTLGVVFMTVSAGFLDFTFWGLRQSIVYSGLGHLQLLPRSLDPRARLSSDVVARVRSELRDNPAVEYLAGRLEILGLVGAGSRTFTFSGIGIEADAESKLRSMTLLRAGQWFTGAERVPQMLIGSGLAKRLDLRPRDMVSLVTYSDRGRMSAADVQVSGIFESGVIEYDARTLLMPLASAQELMETSDFSGLVVTLHDATKTDAVAHALETRIAAEPVEARVAKWDELSPIYGSVVHMYKWILTVFLVIVTIVVVMGIANTMSMAVLERVPEVGVLRALGFSSARIVSMFLIEATVIGAVGAGAGVALGVASCLAISSLGIDMPPPPGHTQGYVAAVHVVPQAFAAAAAIAIVSALIAGVGPSLRAIRREVSDVLRAT